MMKMCVRSLVRIAFCSLSVFLRPQRFHRTSLKNGFTSWSRGRHETYIEFDVFIKMLERENAMRLSAEWQARYSECEDPVALSRVTEQLQRELMKEFGFVPFEQRFLDAYRMVCRTKGFVGRARQVEV